MEFAITDLSITLIIVDLDFLPANALLFYYKVITDHSKHNIMWEKKTALKFDL